MKKMFKYASLGAIALVGAVSFSACSSSDEIVDNPDYNPVDNTVKTQFTISLPENLSNTRQAGSTVQVAENLSSFRGMQDIVLIPYASATDRTKRLGDNITLAANSLIKPEANNSVNSIPAGNLLETSKAVLYKDVTVPLGTQGFLFYGKALGTDGYDNGWLTSTGLTGETADITFAPTPIQSTPVMTKANAIAAYVSSIAAAADETDATITWAGCANSANATAAWYNVTLGEMYNAFTSMKAGASAYVQAAVQDLYSSIRLNTDKVSVAIKKAILNDTYAKDESSSGVLTFTEAISGYPGTDNNGIPDGAAALSWDAATPKVATATASSTFGHPNLGTQDFVKIVYPASLYYYVNSALLTSNVSRKDDYTTTDAWATITGKYTNGGSVTSSTKSIAIVNPIQYAVGRLDTKVNKLDATTYYDRKGETVTIPDGGFKLTGVLIGGQRAVDYKFEPKSVGDEYAIFDKTINTESANQYVTATQDGGTNYTLALETPSEQDVYVVLEFENSGTNAADFQGFDGVVKKGCKFYMVALLVPDADTDHVTGSANTGKKVFKQDYKTIVNFTIGAGTADTNGDGQSDTPSGFANAYTTIPDLRTPQLELGFSVDLSWKEGITFNVDL